MIAKASCASRADRRPAATVLPFSPPAGPREEPLGTGRSECPTALLMTLRRAAREAQIRAPLDLERLCADAGNEDSAALWALALLRTVERSGVELVFRRNRAPQPSPAEAWLAALTRAAGAEDGASVAFLTRRYVAQPDRRMAICFARRLARVAA